MLADLPRGAARSTLAVLLGSAALAGCGGSGSSGSRTAAGRAVPTPPASGQQAAEKAQIALQSAAKLPSGEIAARYTCKGANESMPFEWAGVAPTAKEVVMLVRSFGLKVSSQKVNWIVAGISPSLQTIAAGKAPAGSIVGRNSFGKQGYSLCPEAGSPRTLVSINILAYPKKLNLKPGFELHDMSVQVEHCDCVEWGSILSFIV